MIHPQIIWLPYTHLPTTKSSPSVDPGRTRFQISMVKSVLALLNTDVRELISAAIMAANIRPFKPVVMDTELWLTKLNCAWTFKKLQHFKFMTKNMEITKCTNKSKANQFEKRYWFRVKFTWWKDKMTIGTENNGRHMYILLTVVDTFLWKW